jgi:alpha-1,6-mannosyltransferase
MTAPVPAAGETAVGTSRVAPSRLSPSSVSASGQSTSGQSWADDVDNPRSPILAGLLGSLAMMIGSIGVGWLAPVSGLRRVPLFIWMRTEAVGVALSIILLSFGGMLLVRA